MLIKIMFKFSTIEIFGLSVSLYGVFCTLGIIVACLVGFLIAIKKEKIEFFDFTLIVIITLISAFVGAKLLFIIVSWNIIIEIFKAYPFVEALNSVLKGGFVFYGGLIGGAVGLFLTLKIQKKDFFKYLNIFALVLPLGHAFGRIGCFFAGCCYGMKYDGFLSFTYKTALDPSTPLGVPLLPIQLIEAVCLFVLFASLIILYFKAPKKANLIPFIYIVAYSLMRFILEFFRGDAERGLLLNLSTSQWISILLIAIVVGYLIFDIIRKKKVKTEKIE